MSAFRRTLLALAIAATQTACQSVPVNLGSEVGVAYDATKPRDIEGEACGFRLFDLIPIQWETIYTTANDNLRSQAPRSYITDVELQIYWRFAVVGTIRCAVLRAKAYPLI
jgi:hypothetical protein